MMDISSPYQQFSEDHGSSSAAMSSPAASVFSKGHMSKSSASSLSIASSPNPRESFDLLYGSKLGKVAEEQEREDATLDSSLARSSSISNEYSLYFAPDSSEASADQDRSRGYTVGEHGDYSTTSLDHYHFKRQKAGDSTAQSLHRRLSSRFGSMSRRLKNRSGAGPQLSIVTHTSAPASRSGSAASMQLTSPAMSAISKHESLLPPSPAQETMRGAHLEDGPCLDEETQDLAEDQPQATTPLLPPVFTERSWCEESVQSPLQSPSIAPTPAVLPSDLSLDTHQISSLPSPPLSTKPSMVSIQQRSRANTATAPITEIPPLQLISEDPWSNALGHANFNIHPEPYLPEFFDLEAYTEFRQNWDTARRNYTKHLARTIEHYGPTSKVYKLTEQKWGSIDRTWKQYYDELEHTLGPQLKRVSDRSENGASSSNVPLDKPASRVVMPEIDDKCGKFPELGDSDIVGPMEVAPPRSAANSPAHSPTSPRKRSLLRFLSDMLGKA